jgi:hypothetical protein
MEYSVNMLLQYRYRRVSASPGCMLCIQLDYWLNYDRIGAVIVMLPRIKAKRREEENSKLRSYMRSSDPIAFQVLCWHKAVLGESTSLVYQF